MPGDELRETRETVGDAFDGAEPGRPCANRSKKSRQNRRGCFVAPVAKQAGEANAQNGAVEPGLFLCGLGQDRKSTRLNSSHGYISYAVFCFKKKNNVLPAPTYTKFCYILQAAFSKSEGDVDAIRHLTQIRLICSKPPARRAQVDEKSRTNVC